MARIRVLLAEDHTVVRQGLRKILDSDSSITVVGEAADGRAAVEAAKRLRPSVVVIDIGLPGLNGIEATSQIIKSVEEVSVLILSMHAEEAYVRQSLKAGARGYLLKDAEDVDLIKAVKSLASGGSHFSPAVSKLLLSGYLRDAEKATGDDAFSRLSGREREVLQLISEGQTNKEIARLLSLSINTVESHRKHVMDKLKLHNTADIVRYAVRKGIVE